MLIDPDPGGVMQLVGTITVHLRGVKKEKLVRSTDGRGQVISTIKDGDVEIQMGMVIYKG